MDRGLGLEITELRLGLPGATAVVVEKSEKKRAFSELTDERKAAATAAPRAKSQVVGWPPVCSYRRKNPAAAEYSKNRCVKVSMDGAICLRKIDLSLQEGYSELAVAVKKLFGCDALGEGLKDEEKGEYNKLIYEDKDGDWMLVGDVPWEMFIESCKRLRIMKRSEIKDLGLPKERDFLRGAFQLKD
ncbi:hypothetical protein SAY87_005981 [Trapa incisa]|uniref:Auxin-responsive protein n=1 Tax=Trapa incisa TaxID=236973 RepID=A0AAN7Q821_9MYRT|nr:hypothetical protein SAY87_005981 [Trapa incisa]